MIDLDEEMFTLDDDNEHVLTPIGQEVVDWANTLPVTGGTQNIPGKRQQSAVCAAFNQKFGMTIEDFGLTKDDYNHVMGSSGPPRYDLFTGIYYDYGAYENGHPSGELICTDQSLIVEKGSKDGEVPPPETGRPPSGALPGRDPAKRDERQAERDARQGERDASQDARQTKRDDRRDERDRNN